MVTTLITEEIWTELRRAVKATREPSWVAVAYFGKGADARLKLAAGSRLVVDASLGAVKSGQTHPLSLLRLVRHGVRVFSVENLHAKVYLIGRRAFIGSANASRSSAERLLEAVVATTDPSVVKHARKFVQNLCMDELSPDELARLQKQYRDPKRLPNQSARAPRRRKTRARISPLRLTQLRLMDWPESETRLHADGLKRARARREHRDGWRIQDFRAAGQPRYRRGELVMQLIDEGRGRTFVEPPGKVLNIVRRRTRRGRVAYVFVEVPIIARRPHVLVLARKVGRGARKALMRDGLVRDQGFAQRVLQYWSRS